MLHVLSPFFKTARSVIYKKKYSSSRCVGGKSFLQKLWMIIFILISLLSPAWKGCWSLYEKTGIPSKNAL